MKLRKLACTFATIAFAATPAMAQHAGFRIGIAPTLNPPLVIPGFSQPMVVPFTAAPAAFGFPTVGFAPYGFSTFGFPPTQAPLIVTRPEFHHRNGLVAAPSAPVQIIIPGSVITNASQARFGPTQAPAVAAAPVAPVVPWFGMPRTDVLRQFGQPSATVITRTTETLYFTGGVTVIIQNGQVAGPR